MEHPRLTNNCSAPASGFGVTEVPVPPCALLLPGSNKAGSVWREGEGLQQLPLFAGFSSLCLILGSLRRDFGFLLVPECLPWEPLCADSGVWLCLLISWEATESPGSWEHFGMFSALCVLLRDWQHKEILEKGRNARGERNIQ